MHLRRYSPDSWTSSGTKIEPAPLVMLKLAPRCCSPPLWFVSLFSKSKHGLGRIVLMLLSHGFYFKTRNTYVVIYYYVRFASIYTMCILDYVNLNIISYLVASVICLSLCCKSAQSKFMFLRGSDRFQTQFSSNFIVYMPFEFRMHSLGLV